jgi:hypothetical protein
MECRMWRWILAVLGVLGAFARPAQVAAQSSPAAFNPLVTVSSTAGQVSDLAAVTLDGTTIYVAWREAPASGQQIRLRRSTNGGVSFIDSAAGRVVASVDPAETVYTVRVAAAGPLVYVLYTSGVEPRLAKARLARSADGGATFAPPMALAGTLEYGGTSSADLAVDGAGVVHVVIEDRDVSDDIHYLVSTDQGITFSAPVALGRSPKPSERPRIAARGPQIAVVWEELSPDAAGNPAGDIAFIYSIDAGASFGAVRNLSATAADSNRPAVAIGNAIQVVWTEGNSVALRSSPDGAAFTAAAQVGVASAGETIAGAAVGSAVNTVHVSWTTVNADGVMNGPFYRRSTDGAGTFAAIQDLRFGLVGAPYGLPAIANGTAARIVWPHSASGFAVDADVLLAGQPNCGVSWAAPVSGNWNDATKWSPAVIPGAGSSACITVEGATPYTVTVPAGQNAGELTIGHATSEVRPIVRITGSLSIGSSLVNSGELTFGIGGQIASAAGSVMNTERGRLATQAGAPASLNAIAVNYGEVDLAARLTIATVGRTFTNFGPFTIRPAGSTVFGSGFVFNQNAGMLKVEGLMEFSAEFNSAGDTFNFNGGSVEGTVIIQGHSRLNIGPGSEGAGTFQFERNVIFGISSGGHLAGNIAPAQTVRLLGTVGGSAQANVAAGLTNAGTIELSATATNAGGAALAIQAGTVVNTGTILVERAGDVAAGRIDGFVENRGTLDIRDDLTFGANGRITNLGTTTIGAEAAVAFGSNYVFNQNAGVLRNVGRMEMSAEFSTAGDTFNFNGGAVEGTVIIQGHSRLNIGPGSEGAGTFQFERNSASATLTGNVAPGQTLRLITQPGADGASVVAANGFTNAGTIMMDAASLVVTAGTLVNTGTIAIDATSPVIGRAIDANMDNRGTFTVRADLHLRGTSRTFTNTGTVRVLSGATVSLGSTAVFNQQAGLLDVGGALVLNREFNTGPDTFNFNGGEVHGFVTLQTVSNLNIGPASTGRGEFVFRVGQTNNSGGTMTGNIAPLQAVRIIGCCGLNQGQSVTAANGFTNFGTIVLASEPPTTNGAGLVVTAGTLVNRGDIRVEDADGRSTHSIQANIENHGRIQVSDSIAFSKAGGVYANHGMLSIATGTTLSVSGNAAFTNAGVIDGGGTLALSAGTTFKGVGNVTANIVNSGRFGPGLSPGVLTVQGSYQQNASGALDIEIAGANAGTGYDRLNVTGAATLAGTLNVGVLGDFCPAGPFTFMTFGSRAGDFTIKNGLNVGGGRTLVAQPAATAYALAMTGPTCNTAPVANDDGYATDEGLPLIVAAPGVLGNDTDAQNDTLSAVLALAPQHGIVALNSDGSFTYTPNAAFSGTDSFSYRANDGGGASGIAVVTITVRPSAPPAIAGVSPDALFVGLIRQLRIDGTRFANPSVILRKGDVDIAGIVRLSTPTTIHVDFDLTTAAPGPWTVIVQNQNGQSASAPIFVDPAIIWPAFAWDGVRGYPVQLPGQVFPRPNYLTVLNVGWTDGMVLVTLNLPHPAMRLKLGDRNTPLLTGGSVDFLVWAPKGIEIRVPLYWGISPGDLNMPGMPVDPAKPSVGEMLTFDVEGQMGLTAGGGQLAELLVELIVNSTCGEIQQALLSTDRVALHRVADAIAHELKAPSAGTVTPQTVIEALMQRAAEDGALSTLAVALSTCEAELSGGFVQAWRQNIRRRVDRLDRDSLRPEENHDRPNPAEEEFWRQFRRRFETVRFDPPLITFPPLPIGLPEPPPPPTEKRKFRGRTGASWDPNDKAANSELFCEAVTTHDTVECGRFVIDPARATDPIEYVIRFENKAEATAPAENVVITDVLDHDLDPSTLKMIAVSHPGVSYEVAGNVATFRFNGINLPPNVQTPEGEGDLTFTIEPRPGLASGTEIRNSASIVFDFNPPIVTPEVVHVVDTNPPATTATPSVDPTVHGWNRTDVTVTLRGADGANGSGVKEMRVRVDGGPEQVVAGAAAVISLTDEGVHTISYFAVDNVGNTEAGRVVTVRIDKTAPVVTGARATPPNRHGWNNGPVVVSFTASDTLSGIDGSPTVDVTLGGEGANQSASLGFIDKAGNRASATVDGISIDVTAPTIAGAADRAPNAHGWYNANVAVSFTCADALSGVDGCGPTPQVISEAGSNLSRTAVVTDRAGNTAQATAGGINLDKAAPAVACSNSAPALWPPNHKLVTVQTAVTVTDGLSGPLRFTLLRATSNEPDNGLGDGDTADDIQDFAIGAPDTRGLLRAERSAQGTGRIYSLVYEGVDLAGNSATCTTTVTVPQNQGNGKK